MAQARRDANRIPSLLVEDIDDPLETLVITGADLTGARAMHVAIVDGSGDQITSFGGGIQYTEGDTDATITGTAFMWEDTSDTLRAVSASKPLPIGDAGGSLTVDNAGLTELAAAINGSQVDVDLKASDLDLMLGTDFSDVFGTASLISGTPAVKVEEQGTVTVDLGANNDVTIDNSSIVHAEDSAHSSGHDGIMPLAVRNDTLAALAGTDGDYAPLQVDGQGALYTVEKSLVDTNNSSTSTLTSGSAFTGTGTDVQHYASLVVAIEASHDSAADGLQLQFSSDNTNWDIVSSFTYVASAGGISYAIPIEARYFRVVYTNGGTGQTHFRLQTILHANAVLPTDGRLSDDVSPEKRGTLTKAAIIAQASGAGDFVAVQSTNGGSLKVSLEEAEGLAGQKTMANSVPVVIASDQSDISIDDGGNSITVDGTVTANLSATDNAVLDSIDSDLTTIIGHVDGLEGSLTDIETNTDFGAVTGGGTETGALRVTIANNSTGVLSVDDGGGALTVDGTVTANLSATDNAVLDQIETNTSYGDNTGGGTEAGALRVTLANNSTGVLSVDDNGGSLTVDSSDLSTLAGAVSGTEMQVDVVTMPAVTATQLDIDDLTLADDEVSAVVSANASAPGCSTHFDSDGDNTAQSIKASAGRLYGLEVSNPNSSDAYIQLFNTATGSVTVGTTTPVQSFFVPAGDGTLDGAMDKSFVVPIAFDTAITYACTTTATGNGDPSTGLIVNATFA